MIFVLSLLLFIALGARASLEFGFVDVQEQLFKVAGLPMVDNCMIGYNSCMSAYAQVSFA